ncbi:MAG: hypothetical protein PHF31_14715 [Methylobacter sp.]|nr:hypothetical protein [Methylobacter sp.]
MKQILWLFGIVVLNQIMGCASIMQPTGNINERIDYWLEQQEYGKALELVADLDEHPSPDVTDPQEIQKKILGQAERYEQRVMADAEKSANNNDWHTALALYQEALSRLPESKLLQQGQQQLLQRQQESLARLELDHLIAKGEWMRKDLLLSKKTASTASYDWFVQYKLSRKEADAQELATELAEHGRRALESRDLPLAKRILPLAMSLYADPGIEDANRRLQELLKEEDIKQKRIIDEQQKLIVDQQKKKKRLFNIKVQRENKQLMADFKKAYEDNNLIKSQQLMRKLEKSSINNKELQEFSKQLDNDVAEHVQHLIETGVTYYSRQQYEQAISVWKEARILDPKNERLTADIGRATRVLGKLQSLREKQGVEEGVTSQ